MDGSDDLLLPPVKQNSLTLALASVVAEGKCYLFYYDSNDENKLCCAVGKENEGYPKTAITIPRDFFPIPQVTVPSPLAAGYDPKAKEIHLFYVGSDSVIAELISPADPKDLLSTTWKKGDSEKIQSDSWHSAETEKDDFRSPAR
ncbi:hypothetical protein B7494_g8004 [Chlorociboria aeruginascens]|nr:hypothetical protein B7494_g8004 [Chlorociboria aeruginascens]